MGASERTIIQYRLMCRQLSTVLTWEAAEMRGIANRHGSRNSQLFYLLPGCSTVVAVNGYTEQMNAMYVRRGRGAIGLGHVLVGTPASKPNCLKYLSGVTFTAS